MDRFLKQVTLVRVLSASAVLLAVLVGIGLIFREDVAAKPYLKIAGSGFMFNYRVADAYYGISAVVQKPVPTGSLIEARFEDPAGGPPIEVSERVTAQNTHYGLRTPPLRGIEKDKPYRVDVKLVQVTDGAILYDGSVSVKSQMSDAVMPPAPLTIGPGYMKNPNLPKDWQTSPQP